LTKNINLATAKKTTKKDISTIATDRDIAKVKTTAEKNIINKNVDCATYCEFPTKTTRNPDLSTSSVNIDLANVPRIDRELRGESRNQIDLAVGLHTQWTIFQQKQQRRNSSKSFLICFSYNRYLVD
jgi:hypothetical protein